MATPFSLGLPIHSCMLPGTLPSVNVCVNEYLSEQSGLTSTLSSEASPGAGESKRRCRARHSEPPPLEAGGDIRARSFPRGLLEEAGAPCPVWQEIFLTLPCPSPPPHPLRNRGSYLIPGINQGQKEGSVARVTWLPQRPPLAFSWFWASSLRQVPSSCCGPRTGARSVPWLSHTPNLFPRPLHAPQPVGRGGGSEAFPERQLPSLQP